jgi:hypothetical protein
MNWAVVPACETKSMCEAHPELTVALAGAAGFRLLTGAEPAGPIDAARWPGFSRHDLRSRAPRTLGEALFNYGD